jgi:serine/threonine-protein kinase
MATVFLAHDLRHDRPVALKVLHPELAATLGPERFLREIKLAARLQHPHILTVHDSGETAGQLWFTMPFVEGESLRDRLRREPQLPVEVALRIGTDAARALQYAHDHGVIHRDIKPENLLLTKDGSTLVADFGIARALSAGDDRLTETGLSVGTPTYMSPEQAAGDRHIDARTDVYSLGTVLYEMLAGEPPFTGATAQTVIAKRLSGEAPRLRHARPSVPESVEQAVSRALAPLAADRFASAAEFARGLQFTATTPAGTPTIRSGTAHGRARRRLPVAAMALGLGILLGLGVLFAWRRGRSPVGDVGGAKVLAVLPFENLGDSAQAYFADGVSDEVRGKLSQLRGLAVIARASSNEYRRTSKPPQQIAHELGAEYLLTATVRWDKHPDGTSRVRVSPELVRVEPGTAPRTKWQQGFDAALTDVFQVQADIAGQVAQALNVALGDSVWQQLAEKPTQNLTAYDAFLRGEAASHGMAAQDPPSLRQAIVGYEQAVALDSMFAAAWAQLSRAHSRLYVVGAPTPVEGNAARAAAERALALAPHRPEGRLALGEYYSNVRQDNARAFEEFEQGRRLAPEDAELLSAAVLSEEGLGRWEAALAHLRQAQSLDPRSVNTAASLASALLWLRRYPEALAAGDRSLALAPTNLDALETRAMVSLAQGDLVGAQAVVGAVPREVDPGALVAYLAYYWDLFWILDDAQQQLLLHLPPEPFDDNRASWAICLAQTYAVRGDQARARAYADSARAAYELELMATPEDAQLHVLHGLSLAYLGQKVPAIREGERGVALLPITENANNGGAQGLGGGLYIQHQLVRIYILVGEPEKALDKLEPLLKLPYYLSPGWLKIDPTFAPLRGNPRFERLVNGS